MFSRFFIHRPIFATVLSVLITLIGGVALWTLPVAQYPKITPPAVQVSISYPGANAQIVADTVGAPIEQQVTGVPGMLYMSSQSGNDGQYSLSVTFDVDTDLNTALVMVQNRVTLAMPLLPTPVQNQGITIRKRTPDILMIVNLLSPQGNYDDLYLSNYGLIHLRDELLRVDGVSDIFMAGERDYAMRIWLNPQKLASLNMSAVDVVNAIRAQNHEAALGVVGQPPARAGQTFQLPINTLGRLTTPEQFGEIIVKTSQTSTQRSRRGTQGAVRTSLDLPGSGIYDPLQVASALQSSSSSIFSSSTAASGTAGGSAPGTTSTAAASLAASFSGATALSASTAGGATSIGGATSAGGATASGAAGGVPTIPAARMTSASTTGAAPSPAESITSTTETADSMGDTALGELTINSALTSGAANPGGGSSTRTPTPAATGIVRLRDVARIELGAQNYNLACLYDGKPSVGLLVYQLPGTNALDVAGRVQVKMKELQKRFPPDLDYEIAYDTTHFIRESITDVVETLLLAVVLVGAVVLAFLQNWRAVLIPMAAVPVAIIGTFSVMALAGFSLNNISLFGLVLAIGIVVDDAIVVVENVERWLEHGLAPREATEKAMDEVTGPIVAVALVLCTVFVPCAFISGITGRFFREFAITIAVSTLFSALNSLTMSPALAALLLRPSAQRTSLAGRIINATLGWFFRLFNAGFDAGTRGYHRAVGWMLRLSAIVLVVYAGLLVVTVVMFRGAPTGFVPQQDQGRIIVGVQLPDSASLERSTEALKKVEEITRKTPGVDHTISISGMSFVQQATGSNFGSLFATLDPFEKRQDPKLSDEAIMARLRREWQKEVKDAQVLAFAAPPVPGLSVAGGFKIMVEDKSGLGLPVLQQQTDKLVDALRKEHGLTGVSTQFRSRTPQLYMDIDRAKLGALGVPFGDAFQALQIYLGSLYVNSFNEFGRHWQVSVQAEGTDRARVDQINLFEVRNVAGQMVPLGSLVTMRETTGPIFVTRYNLSSAAPITGGILPNVSSSDVIFRTEAAANATLPRTMKTEWTELMFMQIMEGNTAVYVFSLAVLCVFLTLAALYESWTLPLAVILVVPLCVLCSLIGTLATHNSVNIFVQIGLVVLLGLACKNSILIVEFARRLHEEGKPVAEATQEASRQRLRPILMTSMAFILGVLPLVVAHGAGAEMRRSLGTAVFSGMLGVTLFGVFLTPVFFYVIQGFGEAPVFSGARIRHGWSCLLGAALGGAAGFFLARLGVVSVTAGVVLGAILGMLILVAAIGYGRNRKR